MKEISFPLLCSSTSKDWLFWSPNLTWSTADPDFTLCFQYTILNWIPQIFLWFMSIIYLPGLIKIRRVRYLKRGKFNIFKSIIITFLLLIYILNLCKTISDQISSNNPPLALFTAPVISSLSSVLLIYFNRLLFSKGIHTSAILIIFWFFMSIISTVEVYSKYRRIIKLNIDVFRTVTKSLEFVLVFISFVSNCFADKAVFQIFDHKRSEVEPLIRNIGKEQHEIKICPEIQASFLSRVTYSWLTTLIIKGYRKPLSTKDLYSLRQIDTCATIIPKMIKEWNIEIDRANQKKKYSNRHKSHNGGYNVLPSDDITRKEKVPKEKEKSASFLKALFHAVGHELAFGGFFRLVYDMTNFLMPVILGLLISFIEDKNDFLWHGVLFVICLFSVSMFRTFFYQYFLHICLVSGMRAKTAIIGIIYRKALKLSPASRKGSTVGQIVNLMAVDTQKIQEVTFHIHQTWAAPLTIFVSFYFLWQQLGPPVLAGLGLLFCLIPFNVYIGSKSKDLQIQQMKIKDKRIKMMSEILSGMKILKLYAWEKSFEEKIKEMRDKECKILRKAKYLNSFSAVSWFCAPLLVTLSSFAVFVLISPSNILTPTIAFVSISLINIINIPMSLLPGSIIIVIQAIVSIKRINQFLLKEDLDPENVEHSFEHEEPIKIIDGNFSWGKAETPILKKINMEVSKGQLVAMVGTVGSGKTSLINAILGEMHKISGRVFCKGSIAYVPQLPWCQNASIKDNILFGKDLLVHKYQSVLDTCALEHDLIILPDGDQTEVGEKGINLSGGQKQRISLARAVYQDASIYFLDDPLSAVDSHVGKHIFDKVIGHGGVLDGKTRILVTHGLTYLSKVDRIFVVKDGEISESGTYKELLENDGPFAEFLRMYLDEKEMEIENDSDNEEIEIRNELREKFSLSMPMERKSEEENKIRSRCISHSLNTRSKKSSSFSIKSIAKEPVSINTQGTKLIVDEIAQIGGVKWNVFLAYIRSATYLFVIMVLFAYFMYLASSVVANMYLSYWSELPVVNHTQDISSRNYYLSIYGGLGAAQAIFILIQNFAMAYGTFKASQTLHNMMIKSIIKAPNMFFDVTPSGRILNRVGKDMDTVDINIPTSFRIWLTSGARVIGSVIIVAISFPYFIVALIPLCFVYFFIQRFYICTSRQLKRIDSIKRSPIYSHFQESIVGAPSIRAYRVVEHFIKKCELLTDQNQMAWYPNLVSYRWVQFYLETLGNIIILITGVFAITARDTIGAGLAGLSVSYSFQITTGLAVMVRTACDLESYVVSIERVQEYTDIKAEAPWNIEKSKPPYDWPSQGKVEFYNYSVRYRPGLQLVLRNINVTINSGEKVGIVGRTGAGKSSLALALFRLIEPAEGTIFIDDIDISKLGLHDLRKKITIIPQDPVLFSGTLRMNLDPFSIHSDGELWTALESAYLKEFVSKIPQGLHYIVSESGDNLSVGQRQLICLARALLKNTKLLVLDEATAAIDMETDELIQSSIRRQFKSCTVLTIAHRLNTIMDYDKVLVLDQGRIQEVGSPTKLLSDERSLFKSMAQDAGII